MQILCPICSDLINQADNIYVTKCGHMFHHHCLAQWLERSRTCPQCRHRVTDSCMYRLFPNISNDATAEDAATLQSRLDDAMLQLRQHKAKFTEKENEIQEVTDKLKKTEERLKSMTSKQVRQESMIANQTEMIKYLKVQNEETNKLKEQNESLNKNLQTMNGLQKVLNATSGEVEHMLQGYTDLKTIATFATALKRALCESESKKNESRDKLHFMKQKLMTEINNGNDLKLKVILLEDKLAIAERNYESLKKERSDHKRKAETADVPDMSPKRTRTRDPVDLNTAMMNDSPSNTSLNTLIHRIESSDSPYLSLKQSGLALTALQPIHIPTGTLKPSELAMINAARTATQKPNTSIFHRKLPLQPDTSQKPVSVDLDITYDGLGGHSKLDTFPVPLQKTKSLPDTAKHSLVDKHNLNAKYKLSAKHKLKRPPTAGTQDIGKVLESLMGKKHT